MRNYTEQSYCNALKDQIQHVIGGLQPEPRNFFYDKSLLSFIDGPFAAAFVEETRNITSLICKESCFDSYGHGASLNSSDLNFIWGQDWPGHALRNPPIFWHRPLREADITKLIVATLQDDRLSIRAFLRALCESSGSLNDVENVERFLPKHDDVAVRAEDLAKGKKRIDILFEWGKGGAARVVVLEVKFGASAENPFDVYEEQAKIRLRKRIHPDKGNDDDFSSAIGYFFSYSTHLVNVRSEKKVVLHGTATLGVSCIGKICCGGGKSICKKSMSQIFLIARAHQYGAVYLIKCMEASNVCRRENN